jgi:hypothetical protein
MNTPEEKSKHQSTHRKYRDFTIYRIAKLIHTYNHTRHDATKRIPCEADLDHEWEESWIIKKLNEREQRKRLSDYQLETGDLVRYILPKRNETGLLVKRRYSLTPESYKIKGHSGHAYIIEAQNGDTLTVPRWRLKLCSEEEERQHPYAQEIPKWLKPERPDQARGRPGLHTARAEASHRDARTPLGSESRSADGEARSEEEARSEPSEEAEPQEAHDEAWRARARDKFMRDKFEKLALDSDALIVPSEGGQIIGGSPGIVGSRDWGRGGHRVFIPILTQGQNRKGVALWILIVAQFRDGVATPTVYCPETNPREALLGRTGGNRGRWPRMEDDLRAYLGSHGAREVRFDSHTFVYGLARPEKVRAEIRSELSFLYIADYATTYLFRGGYPPTQTNVALPPIRMPEARLARLKRTFS